MSMRRLLISATLVFMICFAVQPAPASAQAVFGPPMDPTATTQAQTSTTVTIPNPIPCADATCVISQVIKYVLGSIALIATGMFIWGGVLMLTSGGNEKRVEQAKETLAWAAIGIVVIILSWAIIRYLLSSLVNSAHN